MVEEMKTESLIRKLSERLNNASSMKEKNDIIKNFDVPNTKKDINEFFLYAISNIDMGNECRDAWIEKVEREFIKAKIAFAEDIDFRRILETYLVALR